MFWRISDWIPGVRGSRHVMLPVVAMTAWSGPAYAAPQPMDDFQGWVAAFMQTSVLIELGILAACAALAWALVTLLRKGLRMGSESGVLIGQRSVDGVLFPVLLLCFSYAAKLLAAGHLPVAVLGLATVEQLRAELGRRGAHADVERIRALTELPHDATGADALNRLLLIRERLAELVDELCQQFSTGTQWTQ